jgi:prepilin-type N-terminal cleavage/methylation domain-containing protein
MRRSDDHRPSGHAGDGGFTLVELAVAMAILVILVGIAVPTFLGTRAGASDAAAKTVAMTGLKAHQTIYADGNGYGDLDDAKRVEPGIDFEELPDQSVPAVLGVVYVRVAEDEVTLVSRSKSGNCFWARDRKAIASFAENDCSTSPEFTRSW